MNLVFAHLRYGLVEQLRLPVSWIFTVLFPPAMFAAFALPFVSADVDASTGSTLQTLVFAMTGVAVMQFGIGIAEDRRSDWEPYVRTLPVSGRQRFTARVGVALLFATAGVGLAVAIAVTFTAVSVPAGRWAAVAAALLVGALPLAALGNGLGYTLSPKTAVPVCNVVFLGLSFLGGLILPPFMLPSAVQSVSAWLPTRNWAELVFAASAAGPMPWVHVVRLAVWGVLLTAFALWAYGRDEGHRYR